MDWYLDDNETPFEAGQDWYAGSAVNNAIKSVTDVQISEGGVHQIKGKINGKNGGSTGYDMKITVMWFEPVTN